MKLGLVVIAFLLPLACLGSPLSAPNDPLFSNQAYLAQVKVDHAWQYGNGATNVIVAVIDSGVDFYHPDLVDSHWVNVHEVADNGLDDDSNGYVDDVDGYNFLFDSGLVRPLASHGTMVAGIIAAEGGNGVGISGINWDVKIMSLVACSTFGCDDEAVLRAIRYAADNGAQVINMSLGGAAWDDELNDRYRAVIDYAYKKGVIVVAAAGNGFEVSGNGKNLNVLKNSPVCEDTGGKILGVTSVDSNNIKSTFADYGSDCVDLAAPGEDILSTSVPFYNANADLYEFGYGTSFSAPIVAGIAAMLKSAVPRLSNAEVIGILKRTATNIDDINGRFAGQVGAGLVNAENAMRDVVSASSSMEIRTRVSGHILLQVQSHGEAWYVNPDDGLRYYMKDGVAAFAIMRSFALGITDADLSRIPMNTENRNGDTALVKRLKGKILLQVQRNGDAWYLNPDDGKRYFMGKPDDAYSLMRSLGLGITNDDLLNIPVGVLGQ